MGNWRDKDGAQLEEKVKLDICNYPAPLNHCNCPECYKSPRISARRLPQVWSAMPASCRKHSSSLHYCCSWRSHDLGVFLREGVSANCNGLQEVSRLPRLLCHRLLLLLRVQLCKSASVFSSNLLSHSY